MDKYDAVATGLIIGILIIVIGVQFSYFPLNSLAGMGYQETSATPSNIAEVSLVVNPIKPAELKTPETPKTAIKLVKTEEKEELGAEIKVATATVEITAKGFKPEVIDAANLVEVTWVNTDTKYHRVRFGNNYAESPKLAQGESWTYSFIGPKIYSYDCSLYPRLNGRIRVTLSTAYSIPSYADATEIEPASSETIYMYRWSFEPDVLIVNSPARITWVNMDEYPHKINFEQGTAPVKIDPGEEWSHTFYGPRIYYFSHDFDSDTKGKITVKLV
ncbi:MAG: hypothetical protein ABIG20_04610 [archaeon]